MIRNRVEAYSFNIDNKFKFKRGLMASVLLGHMTQVGFK